MPLGEKLVGIEKTVESVLGFFEGTLLGSDFELREFFSLGGFYRYTAYYILLGLGFVYFFARWLRKTRPPGYLYVHAWKAENLFPADGTSADPYLILKFGSQKAYTLTKKDTVNPVWDQRMMFTVTAEDVARKTPLEIDVYDRDTASRDDILGWKKLPIDEILAGDMPEHLALEARKPGLRRQGHLHLGLKFRRKSGILSYALLALLWIGAFAALPMILARRAALGGWMLWAFVALEVVAAIGYAVQQLGRLARHIIQTYVTEYLGTPVRVDTAIIDVVRGFIYLKNFYVGNMPGFSEPYLLHVQEITISFDVMSFLRGPASHIHYLEIKKLLVCLEKHKDKTNVDVLMEAISGDTAAQQAATEKTEMDKAAPIALQDQQQQQASTMIVDRIDIIGLKAKVAFSRGGDSSMGVPVTLADIKLTNFGKEQGGVTSKKLTSVILRTLLKCVTGALLGTGKIMASAVKETLQEVVGYFTPNWLIRKRQKEQKLVPDAASSSPDATPR